MSGRQACLYLQANGVKGVPVIGGHFEIQRSRKVIEIWRTGEAGGRLGTKRRALPWGNAVAESAGDHAIRVTGRYHGREVVRIANDRTVVTADRREMVRHEGVDRDR